MHYRNMLGILVVFTITLLAVYFFRNSKYSFPPGPAGWPFIGNALQITPKKLHVNLVEWADKYGPLYTVQMLGEKIVVLNDRDLIRDALLTRQVEFCITVLCVYMHAQIN